MKKFVLCISLLSAVFCTAGMAQETDILLNIAGLDPTDSDGTETYYLKNVGTGLHMSYGATWGTQCVESQAAHPVVVEDNVTVLTPSDRWEATWPQRAMPNCIWMELRRILNGS